MEAGRFAKGMTVAVGDWHYGTAFERQKAHREEVGSPALGNLNSLCGLSRDRFEVSVVAVLFGQK